MTAVSESQYRAGAAVDGRYLLISRLGEGSFGAVWKAEDQRLNRRLVAVKVLKAELSSQPTAVARFDAEADAMAQLTHPNVVALHDRGEWHGRRYLVMEYVEGGGLAEWIDGFRRRGELPRVTDALGLFEQLCAGIEAAHGVRSPGPIVHRDLKPDNVLLKRLSGGEAQVKVVDFGIAQLGRRSGTQSGVLMGTPLYMAPEQATGWAAGVGPWTDVFALGVILTELLTLKAQPSEDEPWWGTVMRRPHTLRERLLSLREGVPSEVIELVVQCMAAEPEERFRDAHALRTALRDALRVLAISVSDVPLVPVVPVPVLEGTVVPEAPTVGWSVGASGSATETEERWALGVGQSQRSDRERRIENVLEELGRASTLPGEKSAGMVDETLRLVPERVSGSVSDKSIGGVPWGMITVGVVLGSCLLAAGLVFGLIRWDQRPRHGRTAEGAEGAGRAAQTMTARTNGVAVAQSLRSGPLSGNTELAEWLRRWNAAMHGDGPFGTVEAWYAPRVKLHGDALGRDGVERSLVTSRVAGVTWSFDWSRSEWSPEPLADRDVPDVCRAVPGAEGDVWKVRAWLTEVSPRRNPAIGCPRLEGRYLIRLRRTPSGLRVCQETWSLSEGICASCPSATVCAGR